MSVYSVDVYDLKSVLKKMATSSNHQNKEPILPDLTRNMSRLDRMRDYSSALTARISQTPAPSLFGRTSKSSPPLVTPPKQAKSMTTEMYCGPCSRDEMHHEAAGYCLDCSEYFCDTCIKHHKNLKITKNHTVRDRKKMPKIRHHVENDESVEACDLHEGELIRYYCKTHDEPCCSVCATLRHRQCEDLIYIPEIKAKKTNSNCQAMIKHLNALTGQFDKMKDETRQNLKMNDLQKEDFQKSILKVHQNMVEKLQRLEEEIVRDMRYVHENETGYLNARVTMCEEAVKSLQHAAGNLNVALQNGVESKSFLQLKKVAKQVTFFEALMEDIAQKNASPLKFTFKTDEHISEFQQTCKQMGCMELHNKPQRTAIPMLQTNVKSRSDAYQVCDITGSAVLDDGRVLITDMYNESLKLLDTTYSLVTQTKLSAEPWGVAVISSDQVVVSIPREKKLQFFAIGKTLRPWKKIGNTGASKPSQYYGVAYLRDRIYVTCPKDEPPNIKVLDMDGRTLQEISSTNQEQDTLFNDPLYLAVKFDGSAVFVSDSGNNSVIRLDLKDGGDTCIHQDEDTNLPGGVTVMAEGDIFYCGYQTNSINHLSGECTDLQELVGSEGGLLKPQSISYCGKERRLIVTMQKSDYVKVFQLS